MFPLSSVQSQARGIDFGIAASMTLIGAACTRKMLEELCILPCLMPLQWHFQRGWEVSIRRGGACPAWRDEETSLRGRSAAT